jgi:hypothetical protein
MSWGQVWDGVNWVAATGGIIALKIGAVTNPAAQVALVVYGAYQGGKLVYRGATGLRNYCKAKRASTGIFKTNYDNVEIGDAALKAEELKEKKDKSIADAAKLAVEGQGIGITLIGGKAKPNR